MAESPTPAEYRELLTASLPTGTDAETNEPDTHTLYTPKGHRDALAPDVTLVTGGRGVGKTVWFNALQKPELRSIAAKRYNLPILDNIDALAGFGAYMSQNYPSPRILKQLVRSSSDDSEDIWTAVALHLFGAPEISRLDDWAARVDWVKNNPESVGRELLAADGRAQDKNLTHLILFDALDRLHSDREVADKLSSGILRFALYLRTSFRNLRAKVFIRHDMLESANTTFTDASKLFNNKVDLGWKETGLYSLLFHLMSQGDSPYAAAFSEQAGWSARKDGSSEELTKALGLIASEHMGRNRRKGYTYTWIPNHLADGGRQASPRSFISALRKAAVVTQESYSDHGRALHWEGIRQGVQYASGIRVQEVAEDTPWVKDAIEPLAGKLVPIRREEVIGLWRDAELAMAFSEQKSASDAVDESTTGVKTPATGPSSSTDYDRIIDELRDLGVVTMRADGRLDLPDVYRIGFKLGRKGGVPLKAGDR